MVVRVHPGQLVPLGCVGSNRFVICRRIGGNIGGGGCFGSPVRDMFLSKIIMAVEATFPHSLTLAGVESLAVP